MRMLISILAILAAIGLFAGMAYADMPPDTVPDLLARAKSLCSDGNVDAALWNTQKAISLDPKNPSAHALHGWLLGLDGRYREAIEEEKHAIALQPDNANAYITLGLALASVGNYPGAIAADEKAIELDPSNVRAYINLAATFGRQGSYAGAANVYRKVLRMRPNSVAAHLGLGAALGKMGDVKGSVEQFKQAVALSPENDNAHGKLAWALYRQGDIQGALREGSIVNWIRLQRSGPEYLQNVLLLWGGVFLLFGLIFAVIIFGASFKPAADEQIRMSFFLVFHKERPGRLVITNKRAVFVPEAFSQWFGAQQAELPVSDMKVEAGDEKKHKFTLTSGQQTLELSAPLVVLKPLLKRLAEDPSGDNQQQLS